MEDPQNIKRASQGQTSTYNSTMLHHTEQCFIKELKTFRPHAVQTEDSAAHSSPPIEQKGFKRLNA